MKKEYAKVDLATDTVIFDDKEAWPNEWYVDSLAVTSKHWGEHIASSLSDYAFKIAEQKRFNKVSLNVDKENPRAQKLYVHKGFKTVDKMTIGDRNYDHMIKKV